MSFDYKNILIMGYGRSGKAVEEILKKLRVSYKIYDENHKINGGNYYSKLNAKKIKQFDLLVISPGISIYNKYIVMAEKFGIKVVGELEFGYWFTDSPVVAVTGTNGKTTTTSLINDIISTTYSCDAYGNIGEPLSTAYEKSLDYLVCEVSSFQLESTYCFKPYISVILNIAEDHLDRHKNMENYIKCKMGLLKNCTEKSIVVLNADDQIIMNRSSNLVAKKYFISKYSKVKGVYIHKDKIMLNLNGKPTEFMSIDDANKFEFCIDDLLASILVGMLMKIEKENILKAIERFEFAPHRMRLVDKVKDISFIDDSKSTNIHSTLNALDTTKGNVVLLLGGVDKNLNFNEIFVKYLDKLSYVVAFGSAKKKIMRSAKKCGFDNIKMGKTFYDAVMIGYSLAQANECVLLSPACASFDEFESYAERGEKFIGIVKEIKNAKG